LKTHKETGLKLKQYIISIIFFSILILLRRPDAIFHAQFWAEDGCIWYKEAYLFGTHCLLMPHSAYLQTISRIGAIFSLSFPLLYAPLIFNLIAFVAQVSPIAIFLSKRFDNIVPNIKLRLFISLFYVAIFNSEINMTLTCAQWHLALLLFLLVVVPEPKRLYVKILDYIALVISGLSGPFSIFLCPIALFELYREKARGKKLKTFVVCLMASIQVFFIIKDGGATRNHDPLGANAESFIQILGNHIFAGGVLGG
jgi:hypothetical protein